MIINCDTARFVYEVLEGGEYKFLFDDFVVIDAGCNIGSFSIWIKDRAKMVHAVDLAPRNIELLNKTIKDNGISNIKTYCCAITGRNGNRWASDLGCGAGDGGWQIRDIVGEGLEVDGYTLNTFMENNTIPFADILKLDIEGTELEVLNSLDFPYGKIPTIVGEVHNNEDLVKGVLEKMEYRCNFLGNKFVARR
jgi:FkbM family methyltransferase